MATFSVFTYGTLQFPAVMQSVIGKDLKSMPASLAGYQRFKFKNRTFPGIVKNKACSVDGMLYQDVDEEALSCLDQFEDIMYERCLLEVQLNNEVKQAFVYVTKDEYKNYLSEKEWNLENFEKKYLKFYLRDISKL